MDRISLFEEYRLVERGENEVNGAWKGAHLLLFFMAFVFGSFCTFCFHMLMYLFDEKCVLFPKLQSLTSLRHDVIFEFIPIDKEIADMMPVDFLSTQWIEKSACYLPTYVPLVSGIFGLVWTTMFLMCSTGSRTLTGLQRPWRILPPVFIFSLAMGGLCIYSSAVTHYGLHELCHKLSEITGNPTCTYTVNVATLAYERRIRGVYQATRLTIFSAWLHTACWLLSALLALARVLLVVDFQLVRVNAKLIGDVDKILESHEKPLYTISPDVWFNTENDSQSSLPIRLHSKLQFKDGEMTTENDTEDIKFEELYRANSDLLYSTRDLANSELSLIPEERNRIARLFAYQSVSKQHKFIVKILYELVVNINLPESESLESISSFDESGMTTIVRQYGQEKISSKTPYAPRSRMSGQHVSIDLREADEIMKEIKRNLQERLNKQLLEAPIHTLHSSPTPSKSSSPKKEERLSIFESTLNITDEMKETLEAKLDHTHAESSSEEMKTAKKSNFKHIGMLKDNKQKKSKPQKVYISDSKSIIPSEKQESSASVDKKDKETQYYIVEEDSNNESLAATEIVTYNKKIQTPKKEKQD
ncbi:uncharacterized protein ACR2FA_005375 [Aphomia sociella]